MNSFCPRHRTFSGESGVCHTCDKEIEKREKGMKKERRLCAMELRIDNLEQIIGDLLNRENKTLRADNERIQQELNNLAPK